MGVASPSRLGAVLVLTSYILALSLISVSTFSVNAVAKPVEHDDGIPFPIYAGEQMPLDGSPGREQQPLSARPQGDDQHPFPGAPDDDDDDDDEEDDDDGHNGKVRRTLKAILDALDVMQSSYFVLWQGTWPSGNDWTRAVMATHVSATLSALSWRLDDVLKLEGSSEAGNGVDRVAFENLINRYFQDTSAFWFGENYIGLRFQAYDDMLWVVLEWLESLKFQELHSELHYSNDTKREWYGKQFGEPAAHRARVFYELASQGWDEELCDGGMIWNPYLVPYKNAITNELFISASVGMYMYFPGDSIEIPFSATAKEKAQQPANQIPPQPGNIAYLNAAVKAYDWLKNSNMLGINNLYADGFHIRGWSESDPGTRKCDVLNRMVYTYNQGVILSGLRGLWLATGVDYYLEDGHELVRNVMKSTGWPDTSSTDWQGLGRGGVLEEVCDSSGTCTQNSHTFKSIFFHHFAEFCRPLTPFEERFFVSVLPDPTDDAELRRRRRTLHWHQRECASYRRWIEHNAHAAYITMNDEGKFGMWWGRKFPDYSSSPYAGAVLYRSEIPRGAFDYENEPLASEGGRHHAARPRSEPEPPRAKGLPVKGRHALFQEGQGGTKGTSKKRKSKGGKSRKSRDLEDEHSTDQRSLPRDVNDRGRGRTVETQAGALAAFRALWHWQTAESLASTSEGRVEEKGV